MPSASPAPREAPVLDKRELRDLRRRMRQHSLQYEDLKSALDVLDDIPRPGTLSQHERTVLQRIGMESATESSAMTLVAGKLSRRRLESTSLTTAEAADRMGVDASRVRQRLGERTLLGFHRAGGRHGWLLPAFQFDLGLEELPELWGRLLRALPQPDETSPTALVSWLTLPREHLGGQSRAGALAEGRDVNELVAEAATFGMPA